MLVLIRHAEVAADPHAPSDTWTLSPDGAATAAVLGRHPALANVDLIATSPEPKALATAKVIAKERDIVVADGLRELDRRAAGWVGTTDEYADLIETIMNRPTESIRGCESAAQAGERVTRAIEDLLAANPHRSLAVVSHGIVLTLYLSALLGLPTPDPALWRGIGMPDLAVVDPVSRGVIVGFGQ
ncbi:MAG TPA: histidine phosphatase family protein [Chloroflexota bacterium]|nr:histidine phosphatase family protein [Chloroflexota bacterium]